MKKIETNIPTTDMIIATDLQRAIKEFELALQNRPPETKHEKNATEAYFYGIRNKLHKESHDYVT